MARTADIHRVTGETDIRVSINLDGSGTCDVATGIGFFDHMLHLFARHSLIDLTIAAKGDLEVDGHHTVEDTGISIGQALAQAMGDKAGIERYASIMTPMDESLVACAMDISGRGGFWSDFSIPVPMIGDFASELTMEFFGALARTAGITLHMKQLAGENSHHIVEAAFKSFARALRQAISTNVRERGVPSTKGTL